MVTDIEYSDIRFSVRLEVANGVQFVENGFLSEKKFCDCLVKEIDSIGSTSVSSAYILVVFDFRNCGDSHYVQIRIRDIVRPFDAILDWDYHEAIFKSLCALYSLDYRQEQYTFDLDSVYLDAYAVKCDVSLDYRMYQDYLNSPVWIAKRNQCLHLHDFKCAMCGSMENLNVHHLNYNNIGKEPQSDLLCVCNRCHKKIHSK